MFRKGSIRTLDAGCGNGSLSYAAFSLGNEVLGVDMNADQIARNREFFRSRSSTDLQFETCNLYQLEKLDKRFDQIICSETLEHLTRDTYMIGQFHKMLSDNGVLHLCCPYSLHPEHKLGRHNEPEDGGHVRDGYTLADYEKLLGQAGFTIVHHVGLGSGMLNSADRVIRSVRNKFGDLVALPLFLLFGWVAVILDDQVEPAVPFSLYVQAIRK